MMDRREFIVDSWNRSKGLLKASVFLLVIYFLLCFDYVSFFSNIKGITLLAGYVLLFAAGVVLLGFLLTFVLKLIEKALPSFLVNLIIENRKLITRSVTVALIIFLTWKRLNEKDYVSLVIDCAVLFFMWLSDSSEKESDN